MSADRIKKLLDPGTFFEIGQKMTARDSWSFDNAPKAVEGDGVVTGHGLIDGNLVFVFSQDGNAMSGSIGRVHAKKILDTIDMAIKMGAPVIGLFDSAGIRLLEGLDGAEALGAIISKYAKASGFIPMISGVFGSMGGGMAALAGLSDFTFMESKAKLFVTPPDAIEGLSKEKLDTSSAEYKYAKSGVVDGVGSEDEVIASIRELITMIPGSVYEEGRADEITDDLNKLLDAGVKGADTKDFIKAIADNNRFFEAKSGYADGVVTGLITLAGKTVGVVANNRKGGKPGRMCRKCTAKAAKFIEYLDAFEIPLLTITDTEGFANTQHSEEGMALALAKLAIVLANADIPKINLVRNGVSSAYLFMNSKNLSADLVYAYADSKMETMDAAKMAEAIADTVKMSKEEVQKFAKDELFGAENAAKRGYVDAIIEIPQTRKYLIDGFEMLYMKNEPYKKHNAK